MEMERIFYILLLSIIGSSITFMRAYFLLKRSKKEALNSVIIVNIPIIFIIILLYFNK